MKTLGVRMLYVHILIPSVWKKQPVHLALYPTPTEIHMTTTDIQVCLSLSPCPPTTTTLIPLLSAELENCIWGLS